MISQNWGCLFRGAYNNGYRILGSILGSVFVGKLPFRGEDWGFGCRVQSLGFRLQGSTSTGRVQPLTAFREESTRTCMLGSRYLPPPNIKPHRP